MPAVDGLVIADLTPGQVADLAWEGPATHLRAVTAAVVRAQRGEVDYVAVWVNGAAIGAGGVDFAVDPTGGELWQLAVHPDLQSRGYGTRLVGALENRIVRRGRLVATLKVEADNRRAQAFYRRLGYTVTGEGFDSWEVEGPDGTVRTHSVTCLAMRHDLVG